MALESAFAPLALRTLPPDSLATIVTTTNTLANIRMGWVVANYPGTDPIASFGGTAESNLRPPAQIALGFAALLATSHHDEGVSGYGDATVLASAVRLISSFANTHAANGGNWGGEAVTTGAVITPDSASYHWQGAFWVACVGLAAKLIWASLSGSQQAAVTAMIQLEADRFLNYTTPYMRTWEGKIVTLGDSKGEENAWNAQVLMLAAGMYPVHAHATQWLVKGLELTYAAAATPLFPTSKRPHNGLTGHSLRGGSNIALNGAVHNHNVDPHPNYMASVFTQAIINGVTFAWLKGYLPAVCQSYGIRRIYRAFMDEPFSGFPNPGTIYDKTGGTFAINWPSGADGFATDIQQAFVTADALAHLTGTDDLSSASAATWLAVHATKQDALVSTGSAYNSYGDFGNGAWILFADWVFRNNVIAVTNQPAAELVAA